MLGWIIQVTIISILFIFLIHHLLSYFKQTLTVPKVKDLMNSSSQKYQDILDTLTSPHEIPLNTKTTSIDLLPIGEDVSMKNELKNFLKGKLNKIHDTIDIDTDTNILREQTTDIINL